MSKIIDWYKLPPQLRGLPFAKRKAALDKWEKQFGKYDWKAQRKRNEQERSNQ